MYVDLQVNGHAGVDFSDPGLTLDAARDAVRALAAAGTTRLCPTVITAPWAVYARNLPILAALCDDPEVGDRVLGIHLEGPFLSPAPGARGAHDPAHLRAPDPDLLARLVDLARGRVALLTLAADQPGAEALARSAVARGIVVSLGHHLATRDDLLRLRDAGATALTHLGNGVPNTLPRHPNPLWDALSVDGLRAMLITDGHHVPESFVRVVLAARGVDGVILTSDATALAGLAPGRHRTLGREVVLDASGLARDAEGDFLVGSAATLARCVEVLRGWGAASDGDLPRLAAGNALRLLGR